MKGKLLKNSKQKMIVKILIVITLILLATNSYATTIGYKNIFFAVNNKFRPLEISANGREKLLSNTDMTISYQPIEIAKGIKIQVNRLIIDEKFSSLELTVEYSEKNPSVVAKNCLVYDETDSRNVLMANQEIKETSKKFTTRIELVDFKSNTNNLKIELQDENHVSIGEVKVDLNNKQIDVNNKIENNTTIDKIPETLLKAELSDYATIRMFEDLNLVTQYHTEEEYRNEQMVILALRMLIDGTNTTSVSKEKVHEVIKEIADIKIKDHLEISNLIATYDSDKGEYKYITPGYTGRKSLCLSIENISYENGTYFVKFIYCHPTEEDYANNNIENLDRFMGEIEFTYQKNNEYYSCTMNKIENFVTYKLDDAEGNTVVSNNTVIVENIISNNTVSNNAVSNNTISNNIVSNNAVSNNTVSNTPVSNNTVANNTTNTVTNDAAFDSNNYPNGCIYEDGRFWQPVAFPGLRTFIPEDWTIEMHDSYYDGPEDEGKISATISGYVNEDKVTYDILMPRFVENCNSTFELCSKIAEEDYGTRYEGAGYGDENGDIEWGIFGFENVPQEYQVSCFCHFDKLGDSKGGVGYQIIENIESSDITVETFEVIAYIFTHMTTTSF